MELIKALFGTRRDVEAYCHNLAHKGYNPYLVSFTFGALVVSGVLVFFLAIVVLAAVVASPLWLTLATNNGYWLFLYTLPLFVKVLGLFFENLEYYKKIHNYHKGKE